MISPRARVNIGVMKSFGVIWRVMKVCSLLQWVIVKDLGHRKGAMRFVGFMWGLIVFSPPFQF